MTQPPSRRGGKSRIVIDVARVQAEARARKGHGFESLRRYVSVTGLIVAGLIVVLLVGGYVWWQGFKKSPPYSLALLVDAAQRDDAQTVGSLIDADSIAQGFIPQVIDRLAGADSPVPAQARASLTSALPQLLPHVRDGVRDEVAGMAKSAAESMKNGGRYLPFPLYAIGLSSSVKVTEEGDKATVMIPNVDKHSELTMRRDGERWKVVAVKDERIVADIATRLASSIPAAQPAQPPQPTRRKSVR
jgi:hypothetical protein